MPAASLAAKPHSVSHVAAATLPLAALTAWQALADHAAPEPGEQVLVQGGAGGVLGIFAVQLAVILGGHVAATGRSTDAGFVRDLGAERFFSAEAGRPGPAAGGFDVVIDTVGGAVLDGSYGLLREGGLVTLGAPPRPGAGGQVQGPRSVLRRRAGRQRASQAGGDGRRGTAARGDQPDLPAGRRATGLRKRRRGPPSGKTVLVVR